uniref:Uncharacterized protein n=1 Tax=Anguilla anguilla TaxID=7936 RepID=A0A0E9Q9T0_ANGAN
MCLMSRRWRRGC